MNLWDIREQSLRFTDGLPERLASQWVPAVGCQLMGTTFAGCRVLLVLSVAGGTLDMLAHAQVVWALDGETGLGAVLAGLDAWAGWAREAATCHGGRHLGFIPSCPACSAAIDAKLDACVHPQGPGESGRCPDCGSVVSL